MTGLMSPADVQSMIEANSDEWSRANASVELIDFAYARISRPITSDMLRDTGVVSGPVLFWMCDAAAYCAVVSNRGPDSWTSTTVSISMNFLNPGTGRKLTSECWLSRIGKRLSAGRVVVSSDENDGLPIVEGQILFSSPTR